MFDQILALHLSLSCSLLWIALQTKNRACLNFVERRAVRYILSPFGVETVTKILTHWKSCTVVTWPTLLSQLKTIWYAALGETFQNDICSADYTFKICSFILITDICKEIDSNHTASGSDNPRTFLNLNSTSTMFIKRFCTWSSTWYHD